MAAAAPNPEDAARSGGSGGTGTPSALAGDGDAEEAEDFASSSHCSELSRRQNEQRKQGLFCDVTLAFSSGAASGSVQSCEFSAHRSVLAAATDYFTPLLGGQFSESLSGRVEMKEWSSELGPDPETVESVIQYMYTGEIRVSTCNVHEVLELADRYDLFNHVPLCVCITESDCESQSMRPCVTVRKFCWHKTELTWPYQTKQNCIHYLYFSNISNCICLLALY